MKLTHKLITFLFIIGVVIPLAFYGAIQLNKIDAKKNVASLLEAVIKSNGSMGEQFDSFTDNERAMKILAEDGFNLLSYDRIQMDYDDGCVCIGHVNLTFEVNGNPMEVPAIITIGQGNMPNQICVLTPPGVERGSISEISKWNVHACGGDF